MARIRAHDTFTYACTKCRKKVRRRDELRPDQAKHYGCGGSLYLVDFVPADPLRPSESKSV